MANRLQHLRGSEAEHSTFTGAKGEISLVTDTSADRIPTGEVRVHDGTTAGGLPLTLGTTSKPLTNNIVLSSGVGINFNNYGSEDSNSATTVGSNLLDDYEEGTWTPATAGDATAVITNNYGHYVKIGAVVHLHGRFSVSTSFTSAVFDGLPFTINHLVSTSGSSNQSLGLVKSDVGGTTGIYVLAVNGTSELNTRLVAGDGSYPLVSGKSYRFTITYFTNN